MVVALLVLMVIASVQIDGCQPGGGRIAEDEALPMVPAADSEPGAPPRR